jgi:hypothetical protein
MPTVRVRLGYEHDKYGLVVVWRLRNSRREFVREFKITKEELAEFRKGGSNGKPPGVTDKEWSEGPVTVWGKGLEVGDVEVGPGGMKIKCGEDFVDGHYLDRILVIRPEDYSGTPDAPTLTTQKVTEINSRVNRKMRGAALVSLVNGVLEYS